MEERLTLDCEIFKSLRDETEAAINVLTYLAGKEGKEGELTLKLKVSTTTERKFRSGEVCAEWTEPRYTWNISRKVKENKHDLKGSSQSGYMLEFDEDGKPIIKEVREQISLFNNNGDDDENPEE